MDPGPSQTLKATVSALSDADLGIGGGGLGNLLPVKTRQSSGDVAGIETEVVCTAYADRILVLVTQVGKFGCLMQANVVNPTSSTLQSSLSTMGRRYDVDLDLEEEESAGTREAAEGGGAQNNDLDLSNVNLTTLFGTPPPALADLYPLYAMHIAKYIVGAGGAASGHAEERPIVVGLALKTASKGAETQTRNGLDDNDDDEDLEVVGQGEKARFDGIMDLISRARVW